MKKFIYNQGKLILDKKFYASALLALAPFIPLGNLLTVVVIALTTLRKGMQEGLICLTKGIGFVISVSFLIAQQQSVHQVVVCCISMVSAFLLASVLREKANWQAVVNTMIILAACFAAYVNFLQPENSSINFQWLLNDFLGVDYIKSLMKENLHSYTIFESYIFSSILVMAMGGLLIARYIQSLLFYPTGFIKELMAFRASRIIVFLLAITFAGAALANDRMYAFVISCGPLLLFYVMVAGICLCFNLLQNRTLWSSVAIVILPLVIVPSIPLILIYVVFGMIDSMFNIRVRMQEKASE